MALVTNDKNLVKEFVRINFINSTSSLPNWEVAEQRYLLPLIGDDMYDKLVAIAADVNANDQDKELLKKARAIIVPMGYATELPFIQTQLTDAGIRTVSTDNLQAAHRWEYNEVKEYLQESGSFATDNFLKFLFKHKADYADWTGSDEFKQLDELIFKTATEFDNYFKSPQPFRLFWELRPLIREVQDFYITPTIGEDFFNELKDKDVPTDEEQFIITEIKKAISQLTIVRAIEKLSARKTPRGFVILMDAGNADASNSGSTQADGNALSLLYESCERSGEAYLLQLKETLNKEASAQVFATYFTSDYYEAPDTVKINPNDCRKGIIGF